MTKKTKDLSITERLKLRSLIIQTTELIQKKLLNIQLLKLR